MPAARKMSLSSSWRAREDQSENNQTRHGLRGNCSNGLKSNAVDGMMHQSQRDRRCNSATTTPPARSRSTSSISRRSRTRDERGIVGNRSGSVPAVPQIPRRWMIHGALMQERPKEEPDIASKKKCIKARVKKEREREREKEREKAGRENAKVNIPYTAIIVTAATAATAATTTAATAATAGTRRRSKSDSGGLGGGARVRRHRDRPGSDDDRDAWSTNTQPQPRRASASFPLLTPISPRRTCRSEPRTSPHKIPRQENRRNYDTHRNESNHMPPLNMSRAPYASKRRSMPTDPNTSFTSSSSTVAARPQSRLESLRATAFASDNSPAFSLEQPRSALTGPSLYDDAASVATFSQYGRSQRTTTLYDRASQSLRDRVHLSENIGPRCRGTSLGTEPLRRAYDTTSSTNKNSLAHSLIAQDETQTESSNAQHSDSSDDFDDADTTAEVHELKYRITRMESRGKKPPTSSTAASGESSDRPRTATTAPTTVDLSPRQLRKQDTIPASKKTPTPPVLEIEPKNSSPTPASAHPLLHDALARLKDSTQSNVYRAMEAVINDALQLTSSPNPSGSQSTVYAAASSNDRHVKRKADNICRNLTDLCLALCDVQQERNPGGIASSPAQMIASAPISPLTRFSRNTSLPVATPQQARPMSRLEQRKASLLGEQAFPAFQNISPRASFGTISSSEADSTPTHSNSAHQSSRQVSETTAAHRLQRPPSRAATDVGSLRSKSRIVSENNDRRVPSLRESLASRRNSAWNTPPSIREEESHPHRQQVLSSGRPISTAPGRNPSLSKRRHFLE